MDQGRSERDGDGPVVGTRMRLEEEPAAATVTREAVAEHGEQAARHFWQALEAWEAGRNLAGLVEGGPQTFGESVVATFLGEMATRQRDETWVRNAVAQLAKIGLGYLAPAAAEYVDLSGEPATGEGLAPYVPPAGPGPAGPSL
jgi:hypothetical protein